MLRKLLCVALGVGMAALSAAACGSDDGDGSGGSGASGGSGGAGGAPSNYGASPCGTCVQDACAGEVDACEGDPGCAQWLGCLYACPLDAAGNADPACVDACPLPDSTTAQAARTALEECRWHGPGASGCSACGVPLYTHPLLNQQCPASQETNPCWICEDEHCCDTFATCKANPECDALAQCLKACPLGDDACWDQCHTDHPDGIADFGARIGCLDVFCAEPGLCVDDAEPFDACSRCVNIRCGDRFMTCWANVECYLISECAADCPTGDATCIQGCIDARPAGSQDFNDYAVCSTEQCASECG